MSADRALLAIGSIFAFLGVAAGAFGAHGLKEMFHSKPEMLSLYQTAVSYQMYHAFGILISAQMKMRFAGACFIVGTALFSGSLYALALGAPRMTGMITPFGGIAFLVGWASLGVAALKR